MARETEKRGPINPVPPELLAHQEAAAVVREYQNTAQAQAFVRLIDCIERAYIERLRGVHRDDLERLQGQLDQVVALRRVLRGETNSDGSV